MKIHHAFHFAHGYWRLPQTDGPSVYVPFDNMCLYIRRRGIAPIFLPHRPKHKPSVVDFRPLFLMHQAVQEQAS